ncbi:DNA replication/repair protein RecF [Halomonas sp. MCCC 1A17488]|uniref:DNA replication and repair protein RecF n=1 Tax=Billgrantia sulfidoxydans TaxID=2733484 RepID=A0ABX7W0G5_9GAMM|nr:MULTISPECIES: DNA replication/repair protein RecF [Halomonas]MCE8017254.1 DNA replication/repair protein RecF [Halomonas sp. MCCC 1A17488]MCG3240587.1 DNA replication/repair protein RecF [Halomonas sp. MCCC 1A17488]QPP49561.1 DNA replication/repair protein RecF [Halomonas sp. SS10-MC5]QTP53197.1 DNA replication/repair protein RecF [Halomonas sulfidoxydans]
MLIERLAFTGLRNLEAFDLTPSPGINLIVGRNGSGKTSLLEGLHILAMGRSFRTRQLRHVIAHEADEMTLFARLGGEPPLPIGVRRSRDAAELEMRMGGERVSRLAKLIEALPLQLVNPDAFRLLEGTPAGRREFLDWGVFHVKHDFYDAWRRTKRALKHRNALLRHGRMDANSLAAWEQELAVWGERVDLLRREWMAGFVPVFEETLGSLIDLPEMQLRYSRGWDKQRPLRDVLEQGRATDQQMGFTQNGPQRADLRIRLGRRPAVEVLSRGQQKLVVSALKLAQGRLLERVTGHGCLYLIDDLPAELDAEHRRVFCRLLESMRCQAFITSVEHDALVGSWNSHTPMAMFHVKQAVSGTGQLVPQAQRDFTTE